MSCRAEKVVARFFLFSTPFPAPNSTPRSTQRLAARRTCEATFVVRSTVADRRPWKRVVRRGGLTHAEAAATTGAHAHAEFLSDERQQREREDAYNANASACLLEAPQIGASKSPRRGEHVHGGLLRRVRGHAVHEPVGASLVAPCCPPRRHSSQQPAQQISLPTTPRRASTHRSPLPRPSRR